MKATVPRGWPTCRTLQGQPQGWSTVCKDFTGREAGTGRGAWLCCRFSYKYWEKFHSTAQSGLLHATRERGACR